MQEALGIIETRGYATAMEAADAAVKSANVRLAEPVTVGGGKVNIIFRGDVAAVKSALESGVMAASRIGEVQGQVVIPRPAEKVDHAFPISVKAAVKKQ
jgi:ethanolamine utilization protein EutM